MILILMVNKMIKSTVTKITSRSNRLYNVWVHDLRTKDETSCFTVKAKSKDEAEKFFIEDFPNNIYFIQEIGEVKD